MTTDETKKKKLGRETRVGGIKEQWNHFGSEEEDTQASEKPDSQIASNPVSQMVHYPESRHVELSEHQLAESQDKQMVSYLREKKPERKAQIAYLPPGLIKRLKQFAFDHDLEISVVVQVAVSQFLELQEDSSMMMWLSRHAEQAKIKASDVIMLALDEFREKHK